MLDDRLKKLQFANTEPNHTPSLATSEKVDTQPKDATEQRRERVLKILEDDLLIKRAVFNDVESDIDNVIIAVAIRNAGTFEMAISKAKFNGMAIQQILDNLNHQNTH